MCLASRSLAVALSVSCTVLASSIAAAQTPPASTSPAGETVLPAHGLVASPADVTRAVGTEVRVTSTDRKTRKGTLVSLSASAVVLRTRDGETVMPLAQVWKVDKVSHHVRKGALGGLLIGLAVGAPVGMASAASMDVPGMAGFLFFGGLFGGAGAGVGALIGSGMNADRDAIYDAARSTVLVAPILSPRRAGVALAVRW